MTTPVLWKLQKEISKTIRAAIENSSSLCEIIEVVLLILRKTIPRILMPYGGNHPINLHIIFSIFHHQLDKIKILSTDNFQRFSPPKLLGQNKKFYPSLLFMDVCTCLHSEKKLIRMIT